MKPSKEKQININNVSPIKNVKTVGSINKNSKVNNPYIKVTGYVSVCIDRRILLTAEPLWFSLTVKLIIGPEK